jgi:thiol peroxidase
METYQMKKIFLLPIVLFFSFLQISSAYCDVLKITLGDTPLTLMGDHIKVGKPLPDIELSNLSLTITSLDSFKGKVTILSVVPSLDTPTCEKQTHILSEENHGLDQNSNLITISRDLPFAQKRFSKNAKINNLIFLSDYRDASFGKSSGLLIQENRLLARAVFVLDKNGIVRYKEIVSKLAELPNMEEAFKAAQALF